MQTSFAIFTSNGLQSVSVLGTITALLRRPVDKSNGSDTSNHYGK